MSNLYCPHCGLPDEENIGKARTMLCGRYAEFNCGRCGKAYRVWKSISIEVEAIHDE